MVPQRQKTVPAQVVIDRWEIREARIPDGIDFSIRLYAAIIGGIQPVFLAALLCKDRANDS